MPVEIADDPPDFASICKVFDIGSPRGVPMRVHGGLAHRMWRVETDQGAFAVKQLNRNFEDDAAWMSWYDRAFDIEMRAFDAGVPMPRPIPLRAGGCLAEIDGDAHPVTLRAHVWAEGVTAADLGPSDELCRKAGSVIGSLHALNITYSDHDDEWPLLPRADIATLGEERWHSLLARLEEAGAQHAGLLAACTDDIREIEGMIQEAERMLPLEATIMSHRDADQKNFLVRDGGMMLVDWDAAGPAWPRCEIASAALNWAGVHDGPPVRALARATIDGYGDAAGSFDAPAVADLAEYYAVMLRWMAFNLRRVLGERVDHEGARAIADENARAVLAEIPRWLPEQESWLRALSGG